MPAGFEHPSSGEILMDGRPIRSAVLGSALLVFTLSIDEIAVTFFLTGRQNTLPLHIWGLLRRGITPEVNAAAAIIFLLSVG